MCSFSRWKEKYIYSQIGVCMYIGSLHQRQEYIYVYMCTATST